MGNVQLSSQSPNSINNNEGMKPCVLGIFKKIFSGSFTILTLILAKGAGQGAIVTRFDAVQESAYTSSLMTIDVENRQFQEDFCFDSCKEATTCGAVFLKSGTCYLVAEDVALSGSMAPDPEAISYRRIAEEDFDVTNINSWSPSLAHYTHVYNNMNINNENQEESSSNSRSMPSSVDPRYPPDYPEDPDSSFRWSNNAGNNKWGSVNNMPAGTSVDDCCSACALQESTEPLHGAVLRYDEMECNCYTIDMGRMKVRPAGQPSSYRWCIDIPEGWTHTAG